MPNGTPKTPEKNDNGPEIEYYIDNGYVTDFIDFSLPPTETDSTSQSDKPASTVFEQRHDDN